MDKDALDQLSFCVPCFQDIYRYAYEADGLISLSDPKTCYQPRIYHPCPAGCNQEILKIVTNTPVTVVTFDEWQQNNPNSSCDYLIFDSGEEKKLFAFCELTCSVEKYVEPVSGKIGKRAKAYSQMVETWKCLSQSDNPVFQANVFRYIRKIGIFGWREPQGGNSSGAMRSLRVFTRTPSSVSGISKYANYAFGESFDFIQVKYPYVFNWLIE